MKKLIIVAVTTMLFTSCGVGNYTVVSGKADECAISFTSPKASNLSVSIDNSMYKIKSVKDKAYKIERKIKQTALNTIWLSPGTHDVTVEMNGEVIYQKKLFISASEHKIVEL